MSDVLLVTCAELPEGEPRGDLLVQELARRGLTAAWVAWDASDVDWGKARLVVVRSPWDFEHRRAEFVAWARRVASVTSLVNAADALEWNTDKRYLLDLAAVGLPVVPTLVVEDESELGPAIAEFDAAVVKPTVGAGGRGVVLFDLEPGGPEGIDESHLGPGPWVVQPLVESVRTEGETSVFVLGGEVVSQVAKRPAGQEIRVHEEYGGRSFAVPVTEEARELALRALATAQELLRTRFVYARADLMRGADGALLLSELEVADASLYLDLVPANAARLADAVAALLEPET